MAAEYLNNDGKRTTHKPKLKRKNQKHCNERCARLVANRKWWRKSGKQWREEQKEIKAAKEYLNE